MSKKTTSSIIEVAGLKLEPYIPASKSLPEITIKAVILSLILTAFMAAANAYLGLKIGMTVAATIPAAVISMAVLSLFKKSNILENNLVQITVSTGESLAAASVFTLPGLILIGYWKVFPFWQVAILLATGGVLGVLLSIVLRRALVVDAGLKFPEGVAAAEVLKVGDGKESKTEAKGLFMGAIFAVLLKFGQSGFSIFNEGIGVWKRVSDTVIGGNVGFSAIMVGAGYIVGISVGVGALIGCVLGWGILVPYYAHLTPDLTSAAESVASGVWVSKVRIIGVGAMVISGLWIALCFLGSMKKAITDAIKAVKVSRSNKDLGILSLRTEKDIPITYVGWGILGVAIVMFALIHYIFGAQGLTPEGVAYYWPIVGAITLSTLAITFLMTVVYGYIMGIIGSTNSPLSGMTIMGVLFVSCLLLILLSHHIGSTVSIVAMASIGLLFAGFIAGSIVVGAETLQDFKAGQIVGGTPWKLQVMLIVGVIVSALIMAPTLNLLLQAYGIGDVLPDPSMDPTKSLAAPKAMLMATIAQNIFGHTMDWSLLSIGIAIGVVAIIVDEYLKYRKSAITIPSLSVAFGIYMPLDIIVPIFIGGLIAYLAERHILSQEKTAGADFEKKASHVRHRGLLVAAGLVAGESIIGVLIALILVCGGPVKELVQSVQVPELFKMLLTIPFFAYICWYLYKKSSCFKR
ncbi:MAG: oligopeptide transporter, OPT family [Alphaproteobacteria bacterium]